MPADGGSPGDRSSRRPPRRCSSPRGRSRCTDGRAPLERTWNRQDAGRVRRSRASHSSRWLSRVNGDTRPTCPASGAVRSPRCRGRPSQVKETRSTGTMEPKEIVDELKSILATRLKFEPRRAAEITLDTPLPKGVEGSIGLDSLDFIELSLAIEERFGVVLDESHDL